MSTSIARSIHVLDKESIKNQKECMHSYYCLYIYDGDLFLQVGIQDSICDVTMV